MSLVAEDVVEKGVAFSRQALGTLQSSASSMFEVNQGFVSFGHIVAALAGGTAALLGVLAFHKWKTYHLLNKGKKQMGISKKEMNLLVSQRMADAATELLEDLAYKEKITDQVKNQWYLKLGLRHRLPDLLPQKLPCVPADVLKRAINHRLGGHKTPKLPDAVEHPSEPEAVPTVKKKLDVSAFLSKFRAA